MKSEKGLVCLYAISYTAFNVELMMKHEACAGAVFYFGSAVCVYRKEGWCCFETIPAPRGWGTVRQLRAHLSSQME